MGWNFGGAIIDFDFHAVIDALLAPEHRQLRTGAETEDEARSKALIDAGVVALEMLGISAVPADAPISFDDATRRDFDDYAVGMIGEKTVLLGQSLGLHQDSPESVSACERVSRERGAVFVFWFNDASDTHVFSVFREGKRVRYRSSGPGLGGDEGARVPGEPEDARGGHDRQMALLEAVAGRWFVDLLGLQMERFSAC